MQTKNFKGQDLRGWSFKNQDLTGADFSDCDLRGVDFSFANLTDAKFCNARMGRTFKITFVQLTLCAISGVLIVLIAFTINTLFSLFIIFILKSLDLFSPENLIMVMNVYAILFIIVTIAAFKLIRFYYLVWFFNFTLSISGIGALIGIMIARATLTENITQSIDTSSFSGLTIIVAMYMCIGLFTRAMESEDTELAFIRQWALKIICLGGTQFSFAILKNVNFDKANLKYARFKNARIICCRFQSARNHCWALTDNTPLEVCKVRNLVISSIVINNDKNFATLDLRGLDFSNLNLQDFDFSHANLSGANLSHAQLTGAILEGWNIDTETCLDDIDCRYYYYLEKGEKKRMPPEGEEYSAGEFTRIFQKIANTIDFIAHSEMELAAIKLSVEQVRVESGNDDIRVQAIEEKDGFIVVKVTVPKTEDRGVLYHEVNSLKQEYETKIQSLMNEKHIQIGKIEVLKEQLKEQRDDFLIKIQQEGKIIMNNPNISTTITGSTVHGSVATAEKIENSFNTVQDIESQTELKQLVEQLQTLINNSSLPETTKQKALSKTENIAEAVNQPEAEQKTIVQKTLGYFDGLADSLENVPETAIKLGETVAKIGLLFGI